MVISKNKPINKSKEAVYEEPIIHVYFCAPQNAIYKAVVYCPQRQMKPSCL